MDKTQADKETGEVKTPVAVPPTVEEKTPLDVPETAEKPVETPEEQKGEPVEPSKDEESDRDRAFAEMRREIKELKKEKEERETRQSSFDNIRQFAPTPQYQQVDQRQFVDQNGNFNQVAYNQAVNQANQYNANLSRQEATKAVEYKLDEFEARRKHPELNSNKRFERAVANEYLSRLVETAGNPEAKEPTVQSIADELAPYFSRDVKSVEKEVTQKVKEQLTEKEQASLSATGRSQPQTQSDLDTLRVRSRKGDKSAIVERFRRLRS